MKKIGKIFLVVAVAFCLFGGGVQVVMAGGSQTAADTRPLVCMLYSDWSPPYAGILVKEYQDNAPKMFPNIRWIAFDGQGDVTLQAQQVDEAIAMKPAVILLMALDAKAMVSSAEKIYKAGIPLVNFNSQLAAEAEPYYLTFFGPDCYQQGIRAADLLHDKFPNGCKYVYLGQDPGNETSRKRQGGFFDQAAKMGYKFELLGESPPCDWQTEKGKTYMTAFLAKFPGQIDAVHAVDDSVGDGALQAIREEISGVNDKIQIVGYGGREPALAAIKEGKNYVGTIYQSPITEITGVIKLAADIVAGKMPTSKNIPMDMPKVTKENVDQFTPAF
jgi:ABC-type sugar transport system substrate-binding protein